MSTASLFQSAIAWLARTAPQPNVEGAINPHPDSRGPLLDTFGNPANDGGAGGRNWRDVEDRAREHQILISCWM